MKKTFTFREFEKYCDGKKIERIIYNSENNGGIRDAENCLTYDPLHICFSFKIIGFVAPIPKHPAIYLSSPVGAIGFNNVQRVVVISKCASWDEVRIYCKNGDRTTAYCLLIDY